MHIPTQGKEIKVLSEYFEGSFAQLRYQVTI